MKIEMKNLESTTINPPIDFHIKIETLDDIRLLYTLFNVSFDDANKRCILGTMDILSLSNIDKLWSKINQVAKQYKLC